MMTPAYKIVVNDKDKTALFEDRFLSLDITDNDGNEADTLSLTLHDRDYRTPLPSSDELIKIWLGYVGKLTYMGAYTVNEYTCKLSPKQLTINAKSANMVSGLKETKTRGWHEKTLGEIAQTIATEHGLKIAINDRLSSIAYAHINQTEESDINLLRRISHEHDAVFKIANETLIITAQGDGKTASGKMLPIEILRYRDLKKGGNITNKGRSKYSGVKCKWRDTNQAKTITETTGTAPFFEIRDIATTKKQAKNKAQAFYKKLQRGESSLNVSIIGNAAYSAGKIITLDDDFKPAYVESGWIIKRVVHHYDKQQGFTTALQCEAPNEE